MLYHSFLVLQLPIFVVPLRLFSTFLHHHQYGCCLLTVCIVHWSYMFWLFIFWFSVTLYFFLLKCHHWHFFYFFFNFLISLSLHLFLAVFFHYPIHWNLFPTSLPYYTYQEFPKTLPSMGALSHILPFIHFSTSCQLFLPKHMHLWFMFLFKHL